MRNLRYDTRGLPEPLVSFHSNLGGHVPLIKFGLPSSELLDFPTIGFQLFQLFALLQEHEPLGIWLYDACINNIYNGVRLLEYHVKRRLTTFSRWNIYNLFMVK